MTLPVSLPASDGLASTSLGDALLDLSLSPEQAQIRESALDFLGSRCTRDTVRAVVDAGTGHDSALWRGVCELGWTALALPAEHDGLGLGCAEQVLVHEALGAHLAPVPLLDSAVLAGSALSAPGVDGVAWLPALAAGDRLMSLSFDEGEARSTPEGWVLQGRWPAVASAPVADGLLLPARTAQGPVLLAVPAHHPGVEITARAGIDLTQSLGDVMAADAPLPGAACVARGAAVAAALERARLLGALALAAEQVGIASACLRLSLEWTLQREQFGRPIAAFQAVKHRCAQMLVAVESARSAVWGAACVADRALAVDPTGAELRTAAAQARVAATQAALWCAQETLQLHGGAGYTWDVDVHLYFRRAQAASQRFGPVSAWLERVAVDLLDEAIA